MSSNDRTRIMPNQESMLLMETNMVEQYRIKKDLELGQKIFKETAMVMASRRN